jgi:arylsulfatase A-like enzyme/tetratricopeptide (TPR) repeat protein
MARKKIRKEKREAVRQPVTPGEELSQEVKKEGGVLQRGRRHIYLFIPILVIILAVIIFFYFVSSRSGVKRRGDLNVLLIIVDTLRADRVGYSGHEIETPNMDYLAANGSRFMDAVCQYPMTLPSHVCIFTSTFPQYHGIKNNGNYYLEEGYTTLAEILKGKGYTTSAFIGAAVLERKFGLAQGFDDYDDTFKTPEFLKALEAQNLAEDVFESARGWFEKNYQKRFFMWVHFYDPHAPYSPPPPYDKKYADPYDGEVAYTDVYVGKLIEMLRGRGMLGKTLIVLTSDHGEGLGEHEEVTHGVFLYDTTLKVPLVFHCPGVVPKGRVIEGQVRSVDLMPAILDILNIERPVSLQGKSLIPLMEKDSSKVFDSYAETYFPLLSNGWSPLKCISTGRYKYIKAPRPELYDLSVDPGELRNIVDEKVELARELGERLEGMERMYSSEKAPGRRVLSFEEREKLRSLGYVEFFEEKDLKKSALSDPKDKIKIFAQIQKAYDFFWKRQLDKIEEILKEISPLDPDNPGIHYLYARLYFIAAKFKEASEELKRVLQVNNRHTDALLLLGLCYLNMNEPDRAIKELEKIPQIIPQDVESLSLLSMAYRDKGDFTKSLEYLEKAINIASDDIKLRLQLAETYDLANEDEKALREFESILKKDPNNARAYSSLGIFYMNRGQFERGITFLEKSSELSPSADIYYYLGFAYKKVGRSKEAVESLKKFIELAPPYDQERIKMVQKILSSME